MPFENDGSETRAGRALAPEHLLDAHAGAIVQRLLELAEKGDPTALRLCLERIMPPPRERPLQFELPPLATPADAVAAIAAITAGLADGSLSAAEGLELARMVRVFVEVLVLARPAERVHGREERYAEERTGPTGPPRVIGSAQLSQPRTDEAQLRPAA